MQKSLGWIIFLAGISILLVSSGIAVAMVTIIIDDTAPLIEATQCLPQIGQSYVMLTAVQGACKDLESGITSVRMAIDSGGGGGNYALQYDSTTADGWKIYKYTLPAPIQTIGDHTFNLVVQNGAGLVNSYGGTFKIYTQLQGRWFINDQEILSSLQTFYFTTKTLGFKFLKTTGVEDSKITVTVAYSGPETGTMTLPHTAASTWISSKTFLAGQYTMVLSASDGLMVVKMSMFQMNLDYSPPTIPQLNMRQIFIFTSMSIGLITTSLGLILMFIGKKHT
jgi:hypothetical protein